MIRMQTNLHCPLQEELCFMSCDVTQWLCYVEHDIIKRFAAFCRHFVCVLFSPQKGKNHVFIQK